MALREHLTRLHAGEIGWTDFERRTRADWRALAFYLRRGRVLPPHVGDDDIRQELMLAACKQIDSWRPDGGQPLHAWVTVGAVSRTKAWLRTQRMSRTMPEPEVDDTAGRPDRIVEAKRHYERLRDESNDSTRAALTAFVEAGGSSRTALALVKARPRAALACRLSGDDQLDMHRLRQLVLTAVG